MELTEVTDYLRGNLFRKYFIDEYGVEQGLVKGYHIDNILFYIGTMKNDLYHNVRIYYSDNAFDHITTYKNHDRNGVFIEFIYQTFSE